MNVFGAPDPMRRYVPGAEPDLDEPVGTVEQTIAKLDQDSPLYAEAVRQLALLAFDGYDITDSQIIGHAQFTAERNARRSAMAVSSFDKATHEVPADGSLIYYMQMRDTIKIGFTTQAPERRRLQLTADKILALEPGTMETERQRHCQFAHLRVPGLGAERFYPGEDLLSHIEQVKVKNPQLQPQATAA